ncbi:MAG: universal stress protein [Myxococcales bacterium]|nr:MAG: universal stress protein [Myxococcales bacterium]
MRVLIASDLSEASDEALKQGFEMAAGGPVALCHVMPDLGTHAFLAQDYEADVTRQVSLQPRVVEALRGQLARLHPDAPEPEVFIETGSAYDQILHRAEAWGAELIALGTHGRAGLKRWLLGSVADQVVRAAHCQVLVARPSPPGAVLAATDLSEPGLPAIEAAARQAARLHGKLVVMHAMELPREGDAAMGLLGALPALDPPDVRSQKRALASQIVNSALSQLGAKGEIVIAEDDAVEETLQLASSLPARLVVVGTHGRTGLARVVLGSRSSRILEKAPCSVLVTRPSQQA